jgi:hypothetical protein
MCFLLIDRIERRKLRWYGHLVRMAEDRKPRQILEARIEGKIGRRRQRKVWMDDIKEAAGRRAKTIQEARSMAMTRKCFRRWTEDPTLKGKRERRRSVSSMPALHLRRSSQKICTDFSFPPYTLRALPVSFLSI